jgi:hypothetical protein
MKDTLRLNAQLRPNGTRISLGYPYPGTEYHDISKEMGLLDDGKHFHNYLHDTMLLWSDEDRLWIDKLRCCYWWWVNLYLENEGSPIYQQLLNMVDALDADAWLDPETESRIWDLDAAISEILKMREITHYSMPFRDRPEITLINKGNDTPLSEDLIDPH